MKRRPLAATATLTLLMTSVLVTSQNYAQEPPIHTMPEVVVAGQREPQRNPEDGNYSEDRLLGCVEVRAPSTGGALGGSFFARFAKAGIAVMPDMCKPPSMADQSSGRCRDQQAIPPGWGSTPPVCP